MSTRSQIRFEEIDLQNSMMRFNLLKGKMSNNKLFNIYDNLTYKAQIYRHSDGYPSSVIQDLKEFMSWYLGEPMSRYGDPNYAAADFIYFMKLQQYIRDTTIDKHYTGIDKLGYGIESVGNIHGDEEYLYRVVWIFTEDPLLKKERAWPDVYVAKCDCFSNGNSKKDPFKTAEWHHYGNLKDITDINDNLPELSELVVFPAGLK